MPAYLVELKENEIMTLQKDMKLGKQVVWAASAAQARTVAAAYAEGDSNAAWLNADVLDLSTVQNFAHMALYLRIKDLSPSNPDPDMVVDMPMPSGNVVGRNIAIETAGSDYSQGDILTVAGGTAVRPATIRVTSVNAGAITGVALVDPGDQYTVNPTLVANQVTGGNGTGAELDIEMVSNDYLNIMGKAVTNLNAFSDIAGAAVDIAGNFLRLASGGGGDDLGDRMVEAKMYLAEDGAKIAIAGLLGAITDEGNADAALEVALVAEPVAGKPLAAY